MTFNTAPSNGGELSLETPEEEAARLGNEVRNKTAMEEVREAKESGDATLLATAEAKADELYSVVQKPTETAVELHDAHVGAYKEGQEQKDLEAHLAAQEAIQKAATTKVGDIFSARSSTEAFRFSPKGEKVMLNEDRKKIDMVKALTTLAGESRKDKGAAGWEPYRLALVEQIKKTGNESERAVLQELLDEDAFTILARGPLTAEEQKRIERRDVEAGRSVEEAKEHAANLAASTATRLAKVEKVLSKMGVDTYNL